MLTKPLRELVEIRTGYPFRGGVVRVSEGGCLLVQAGNIDGEAGDLTANRRDRDTTEFPEHVLHCEDVLLIARGRGTMPPRSPGQRREAVAASHLMILRTEGQIAFPVYLTWFLNLPATQAKIRAMRSESSVPFVAVAALGQLRVPMPSIKVQKDIAGVQKLSAREQRLVKEIRTRRRVLVDGLLMAAVRRETHN
jgi:hypothetical protein